MTNILATPAGRRAVAYIKDYKEAEAQCIAAATKIKEDEERLVAGAIEDCLTKIAAVFYRIADDCRDSMKTESGKEEFFRGKKDGFVQAADYIESRMLAGHYK